jgi:Uma2 family endonuclease
MSTRIAEEPLDAATASADEIVYPDSDGKPMSDNTKQFEWIVTLESGFATLYRDDPNVFVAGDLLWYPVEGNPKIRIGPDVLVAIGRPKGHRGSYRQWKEGGIAPQLVMEVLSPTDTVMEMVDKCLFYQQYGVSEVYIYDPDNGNFSGRIRIGNVLEHIPEIGGWKSPLTGVRFDLDPAGGLVCTRPDGTRFESYEAVVRRADAEQARADAERDRADAERDRADAERDRADRIEARLKALEAGRAG